jgi:hypothetical protein
MRSKDNPLVKHFFLEHTRELHIISLKEKRGTVQRREKSPLPMENARNFGKP